MFGNATGTPFASTLPLIVFGGQGDDSITGGSGNDILFGDRGQLVRYDTTPGVPAATVAEQQGGGGQGRVGQEGVGGGPAATGAKMIRQPGGPRSP